MRAHQRGLVLPTAWEKCAGSRGNSRHLDIKETRIKYTGPLIKQRPKCTICCCMACLACYPPTYMCHVSLEARCGVS